MLITRGEAEKVRSLEVPGSMFGEKDKGGKRIAYGQDPVLGGEEEIGAD
jgi:hypothetical protein